MSNSNPQWKYRSTTWCRDLWSVSKSRVTIPCLFLVGLHCGHGRFQAAAYEARPRWFRKFCTAVILYLASSRTVILHKLFRWVFLRRLQTLSPTKTCLPSHGKVLHVLARSCHDLTRACKYSCKAYPGKVNMQDSSKVWQEIWRQEYLSPKNLTWCDKNSKRQESSMVQQEPLVPRTSRDVTRTHYF